ncbi:unnamed protein product, partial [Adineta steineri]
MTITQGAEKLQMNNEQTDWNYWQDQMNGDSQFVQYVVGLYKKQQLEKHQHESSNRKENYPSRQQVTHHLPHLMNQPNPASPVQEINQNLMYTTKTSIDYPKLKTLNQVSSTPRRTFDESCSPDKQTRQPQKKTRADNITTTTATPSTRQFGIPVPHLNHAIANKLPCFYIKLGIESAQMQSPSIIHLVKWIRQTIQQQTSETIEDFSLFIPAGNNRYKFGVASKHDFLKLWNCKWPSKIDQLEVEIERPRALPDCCALVIRYAPNDLDQEFIFKEITKTIRSASSMSKINYHRPRATNDYRFCVTDINEYEEILKIGTIGIGHLLLPITTFISSLNMTYCNNCWELGHRRNQCKVGPRCRKCLEAWQHDHQCQKSLCCAQCKGEHFSLKNQQIPLHVLSYNVHGWGTRALEAIDLIFKTDSSICVFTEVGELWNSFTIPHFNIFYQKGTNDDGGVIVAIGKHLKATRININIENTIIIDIEGLSEQIRIIAIYWPNCQKRNLDDLKTFIVERTIFTGDFNATREEWNSPASDTRGNQLKKWIEENNLVFIPGTKNSSKRSKRHIDLIFTNIDEVKAETLSFGTSDHWPMLIKTEQIGFQTVGQFPIVNWTIYEIMLSLVQEYWIKELDDQNVDNWYHNYTRFLAALKNRSTQWKSRDKYRPSLPPYIVEMLKK